MFFLPGTMIEIPSGVCAIEDLKIGDLVMIYDPISQSKISLPIKWIGHKKTSVKANLLNDEAGYPVRILKNAIAENIPNKDFNSWLNLRSYLRMQIAIDYCRTLFIL